MDLLQNLAQNKEEVEFIGGFGKKFHSLFKCKF